METRSLLLLLLLPFLAYGGFSSAQTIPGKKPRVFITGVVYDSQTREPVTDSGLNIRKKEASPSLSNGKFSLFGNPGDTISYKYSGYREMKIIIPDTLRQLEYLMGVFMPRDTFLIPEVVIFARWQEYPSIVREINVSEKMINQAQQNVNRAAIQGLTRSTTSYDAEMNARKVLRENILRAQYKGLSVTPENSAGISNHAYLTHYLQFGSPMVRSGRKTNKMINRGEMEVLLATHSLFSQDTSWKAAGISKQDSSLPDK